MMPTRRLSEKPGRNSLGMLQGRKKEFKPLEFKQMRGTKDKKV